MISNREELQIRLNLLWASLAFAIAFLGVRLMQIQVVQNLYYAQAAERNRTLIIPAAAPRGLIYDRAGRIVATNEPISSLVYMPGKDRETAKMAALARILSPLIRKDAAEIFKILDQAVEEESPIRLAEKLPKTVMFKLRELVPIFPALYVIDEARRNYPQGAFAAHLVGYMGRMNEASWKKLKREGYRVDSWIGRSGIENIFERELRGQDGGIRVEVDARRRRVEKRSPERIKPKRGSNLWLTIDSRLQKIAEDALRATPTKSGAVVALDPRDGSILALASIPDFDPNLFLTPENVKGEKLKKIPEFNLAVQGKYAPGSIFKVVSGAAILEEAQIDTKERIYCPGYFELGNRVFMCHLHQGHRYQTWTQAMANSCDVYFYQMGLRTGPSVIEKYERMFHLGEKTLVGLPGESSGRVAGPETRHARKLSWRDGDTLNLAIGQGELEVTPVQMAMMIAAVANRGTLWRPRFIDRIEYPEEQAPYQYKPEALGRVTLREATWTNLQDALVHVVKEGTGVGLQVPGLVIGGKTGTAQNPGGEDHAWFVAYAGKPNEDPALAVAVLVSHGGHGGVTAVPVAKELIRAEFGL